MNKYQHYFYENIASGENLVAILVEVLKYFKSSRTWKLGKKANPKVKYSCDAVYGTPQ